MEMSTEEPSKKIVRDTVQKLSYPIHYSSGHIIKEVDEDDVASCLRSRKRARNKTLDHVRGREQKKIVRDTVQNLSYLIHYSSGHIIKEVDEDDVASGLRSRKRARYKTLDHVSVREQEKIVRDTVQNLSYPIHYSSGHIIKEVDEDDVASGLRSRKRARYKTLDHVSVREQEKRDRVQNLSYPIHYLNGPIIAELDEDDVACIRSRKRTRYTTLDHDSVRKQEDQRFPRDGEEWRFGIGKFEIASCKICKSGIATYGKHDLRIHQERMPMESLIKPKELRIRQKRPCIHKVGYEFTTNRSFLSTDDHLKAKLTRQQRLAERHQEIDDSSLDPLHRTWLNRLYAPIRLDYLNVYGFPDALDDDPETRLLYEKAINEGSEIDRSVRVMLIGCFGQGKSTLARRLLGENSENVRSTDGIDILRCLCKGESSSLFWRRDNAKTENDINKRLASVAVSLKDIGNNENEALDQSLTSEMLKQRSDSKNVHVKKNPIKQATSISTDGRMNATNIGGKVQANETETRPHDIEIPKEFRKACEKLRKSELNVDTTRRISLWDFGGQFIYYATHQLFHSTNAVYLLVFNLSLTLDTQIMDEDYPGKTKSKTMKDYILFWMHSIHSFAGRPDGKEPVVVLVGTHRDKLKSDAEADAYFENIREIIETSKLGCHVHSEHFAVSAANGEKKIIRDLRKTIIEIGGRTEQTLPAKWIVLDHKLQSYVHRNIISFVDLQKIDKEMEYPIGDEKELKLFLKYKHGKGVYFYFEEDEMSDQIVLNPQFVTDAFKCIIKAKRFCLTKADMLLPMWKRLTDDAILMPELLRGVWKETSDDFIKHEDILVRMLKKHRIISDVLKYGDNVDASHLQPLGFYIVPSLLKRKETHTVKKFLRAKQCSTVSLAFGFEYSGISETIFHRLLAAAIGTWPILLFGNARMLFDNVGIFELDSYHAALVWLQDCRIHLLIVSLCPEYNISDGKGDHFRRFAETVIKEVFRNIQINSLESETENQEQSERHEPFNMTIQCYNTEHNGNGSKNLRTLQQVFAFEREKQPCPDNFGHSLNKNHIIMDWFGHSDADQFPKRKLTHKEYSKLSRSIGKHWDTLGIQLGFHKATLEQIEMDTPTTIMRVFKMLLQWDEKMGDKATFDVLVEELRKLPQDSVNWDIVYNIKDKF